MADNTENEWVASNRILVFARDENAAKKALISLQNGFFFGSRKDLSPYISF